MTIASNTIPAIARAPVAVAAEIPAAPAINLPDFDGEAAAVIGNVFVGLLPLGPRTAGPASNDDVAEGNSAADDDDDGEASIDASATRDPRGDASRKLRGVVGPRMNRARALSGFSQTEAATALGYRTPAQVNLWEMGRRLPPIFEVIKAARLYGVSIDYIMGETHEPDRDPSTGARHAVLRGVRGMLERVAEITVSEIDRHQRLIGPHANNVRVLLGAGDALVEAVAAFIRHNDSVFADQLGGANLVRRVEEFEAALDEARTAIRLHDTRDADLARALAALGARTG